MIEESAAIGVLVERPALRMDDAARGVLRGVDVPQLLDAKPIDLRLAIGVECELRFEHLGQMAAHDFGKEGIFGMEFEPRNIGRAAWRERVCKYGILSVGADTLT